MARTHSISSTQTYLECPQKYKLQYIDRIRPVVQPSYFAFGSAVDKGLNALLTETGSPIEAAESEFRRMIVEPTEFFPIDYDGELLDAPTRDALLEKCRVLGYSGEDVDSLVSALFDKGYINLSDAQKSALTLCCMASLQAKAALMFDAYRRQVLPLIRSVDAVQREIKWKDSDGNEFIAILDAVVTLADGTTLVADNKTASRPYDKDAVKVSPQLAIYSKELNSQKAAFFVMEKTIRKNRIKTCSVCGNVSKGRHKTCEVETAGTRCGGEWTETIQPEVNIQILVDHVSPAEQTITQQAMTGVANAVKVGCFPHNFKSCRVMYGKKESKCPYYEFCRNGSTSGLEKKPEKKSD